MPANLRRDKRIGQHEPILPVVYVARQGETAWSLSGQHTGRTDLPLTPNGERNAKRLGERLKESSHSSRCSPAPCSVPLGHARWRGSELSPKSIADLVEWNYGEYEGRTSAEIHAERPKWDLFRDGCPGGESPAQVGERADRVVQRHPRSIGERVAIFKRTFHPSAGRAMAGARVRDLAGRYLLLNTASLSALAMSTVVLEPVIRLWNDDHHVVP